MAAMAPAFGGPHSGGMPQHPGSVPGHPIGPGMPPNPGQHVQGGMHHPMMGVTAPSGQVNAAAFMHGMPGGVSGNVHALQHLNPGQAQMLQMNPQMTGSKLSSIQHSCSSLIGAFSST